MVSQNYWNPFRDWNKEVYRDRSLALESQNYWNPFRDWNRLRVWAGLALGKGLKTTETLLGIETAMSLDTVLYAFCLKTTETLLGIETDSTLLVMKIAAPLSQNYWNPFRDWNHCSRNRIMEYGESQNYWNPFRDWNTIASQNSKLDNGLKTTETLLGIETFTHRHHRANLHSLKTTETLLGIETE